MNNQFQTAAPQSFQSSQKPIVEDYKQQSFKQSKREAEDSDSGEDFEYYDEEDESAAQGGSTSADSNFDLMAFISNMDIPNTQGATTAQQPVMIQAKKQPPPVLSTAGTSAIDDLFSFESVPVTKPVATAV